LPEIVQEIGSYAGLASVVGLAVLSALYFSQARDVKRLREWAGRAPERAEQGTGTMPGRVVAQPQQPATTPPQVPTPPPVPGRPATPAKPTPAGAPATAAAATGAAAATAQQSKPAPAPAGQNASGGDDAKPDGGPAKPTPATPAAADAKPANGSDTPADDSADKPAEDKAAEDKPAEDKAAEDKQPAAAPAASAGPASSPGTATSATPPPAAPKSPAQAPAATPAAARGAGPPKPPPSQTRFPSRPAAPSRPSPQETAILPPRKGQRDGSNARYIAIGLVGLLVLGGAAIFGVTQLTGDDSGGTASGQSASEGDTSQGGQGERKRKQGGAIKPGSVTVAVLNGTTVPGLAATLSDEIGAAGFKVGTITNFSDQQLAESVVQYVSGHDAEARAVSRKLGIGQREPVNPSSQALAGDATVIVIAGADKSP
jgi:LytR cell envelope-related transcriptional attenuator